MPSFRRKPESILTATDETSEGKMDPGFRRDDDPRDARLVN
jgi:hypothetical protein